MLRNAKKTICKIKQQLLNKKGKKMLSQSEIFNRLPINEEQKAALYKILISERHTAPESPVRNSGMLVEQDGRPLAETRAKDGCQAELKFLPQQEEGD